ncbi:MAG: UDP-glucose/GDP-mannose dehydrogenase family protein, partial [Myxococcota bacterium]|nr:UDP-glucose/GDP-mannose dehydrogenase family protein [Myxococcota bacterium]
MDIAVIGTGYVGLVVGTCLSDLGFRVRCVDMDADKIRMLQDGRIPIYEPGLEKLVQRNLTKGRLQFTTDGPGAVATSDVVYIAVGTPPAPDGSADLSAVLGVAEMVGKHLSHTIAVVIKSTVPVGTADRVREVLSAHARHEYDVVSNPEFLKEGAAIEDFTRPDRIVVGCEGGRAQKVMEKLYSSLVRTGRPILFMDNRSAELTKYASNAMLATKISFMNELALLCEKVGADVHAVRAGTGSDSRIGSRFLFAGAGYGGSCFPKDVQALARTAEEAGMDLQIIRAVEQVNQQQKIVLVRKVKERFGDRL